MQLTEEQKKDAEERVKKATEELKVINSSNNVLLAMEPVFVPRGDGYFDTTIRFGFIDTKYHTEEKEEKKEDVPAK